MSIQMYTNIDIWFSKKDRVRLAWFILSLGCLSRILVIPSWIDSISSFGTTSSGSVIGVEFEVMFSSVLFVKLV